MNTTKHLFYYWKDFSKNKSDSLIGQLGSRSKLKVSEINNSLTHESQAFGVCFLIIVKDIIQLFRSLYYDSPWYQLLK